MSFPAIPIINYHKVDSSADIGITSRHPKKFAADMRLLAEEGFCTVTFKELLSGKPLPDKAVIITFDDGYASVYEQALPLMRQMNFRGVVFIPAAYINRFNDWDVQFAGKKFRHLTVDELRTLHDSGFEIGSHGLQHRLLTAADEQSVEEIGESKKKLEDLLQSDVVSFCYPFGRFNAALAKQVANAGYRFAVASVYYRRVPQPAALYTLKRFNIYSMDSQKMVLNKLKMNFHSLPAYRDYLIQLGGRATVFYQKMKDKRLR